MAIFERDGWQCQICFEPVDPTVSRTDPLGATIDHAVPLAHYGPHLLYNLRLAHRACNVSKNAALDPVALAQMLALAAEYAVDERE